MIWNWLGKNWEPIIALAAMVVGLASLALSISTYLLADADSRLGRAPLLTSNMNTLDGILTVTNVGNGPAVIYRAQLGYKDRNFEVGAVGSDAQAIAAAVAYAFQLSDASGAIDVKKYVIKYTSPITIIPAGGEVRVFEMPPDLPKVIGEAAMFERLNGLRATFCFTDILGQFKGYGVTGSPVRVEFESVCPPPPQTLPRWFGSFSKDYVN